METMGLVSGVELVVSLRLPGSFDLVGREVLASWEVTPLGRFQVHLLFPAPFLGWALG